MVDKPKASTSLAQKELDKAQEQFENFDNQIKDLTLDRMNTAPKEDREPQTQLSQKQLEKSKDIYLKPKRTVSSVEKFDEKWREKYNFDKEYVYFIAENIEIGGEDLDLWTKPYPGVPSEDWIVPVNKPVWGPRYLAEQIKRCCYHRLVMKQNVITETNSMGQMFGAIAADTTIQRLDAKPASTRKSIFMGAHSFS